MLVGGPDPAFSKRGENSARSRKSSPALLTFNYHIQLSLTVIRTLAYDEQEIFSDGLAFLIPKVSLIST